MTESPEPGHESGMGLIELVVAISILAFVMVGLGAAMGTSLTLTRSNRDRIVAANLASQELELARARPFAELQPGDAITTETVDGVAYTVARTVEWVDQSTGEGACAAASSQDFLRLSVAVTWPGMKIQPIRNQTVITPVKGTFDPLLGNIAVEVLDAEGKPAVGRTVRLSGGGTTAPQKYVPSNGCVFFAGLQPSTTTASSKYKVTLPDAGYVDDKGASPAEQSAIDVVRGETTSLSFLSAPGESMAISFDSAPGHSIPTTFPYTVANTALQPNGTMPVAASGSPLAIRNLFPWSGGYRVWAGDCRDADPEGKTLAGVRYHATGVRPAAVRPADGAVVELTPVILRVMRYNGSGSTGSASSYTTPRANTPVYAVHDDSTACAITGTRRYLVGTTNASGVLQTSLPFGQWRFEMATSTTNATVLVNRGTTPTALPLVGPSATALDFTLRVAS